MKISKIEHTTYETIDDSINIRCDREAANSILAGIIKYQETDNKIQERVKHLEALVAECRKFVDSELQQSIEDLNNF